MKLATATRNFAKCLTAAVMAVACTVKESAETQAPTPSEPVVSSPYSPGVAIVEFDDSMLSRVESDLNSLTADLGLVSLERVFPDAGEYEDLHRREGLHRFYVARLMEDMPVTKAVDNFKNLPGVLSVTPSRKIYRRAIFNDPKLGNQWDIINTSNPAADIHVQEVWQQYTMGDPSVIVAIMDEGVYCGHEDLKDNIWEGEGGIHGYNAMLDNNTINYSGNYASGHGTHVAGTVAAVNNNGIGVCGIAGGDKEAGIKGVSIMPVPLLYVNAAEYSAIYKESVAIEAGGDEYIVPRAYTWAADHGAVISQNSWGYEADGCLDGKQDGKVSAQEMAEFKSSSLANETDFPAMRKAVDYFMKYAGCDKNGNQRADSPMKGGLIVFAAGNEGGLGVDYDPFCDYDAIISVGATGKSGSAASYSQYGSWVDIAAPGGNGSASSNSIWSTLPTAIASSGYGGTGWAGTSMAAPHVSGVLALIVSYFGGPGFTADDARAILFGGLGETIGTSSKPVGKKLDALDSFTWALSNGYHPGGGVTLDPLVLPENDVTVHAHEVRILNLVVRGGETATLEVTPGSSALEYDAAKKQITITGRNAQPGSYKAVFVMKERGKDDFSVELSYTLLPNHAPYVSLGSYKFDDVLLNALDITYSRSKPADLAALFVDDDGEVLDIKVTNSDSGIIKVSDDGDRFSIKTLSYGLAKVTVTASDSFDETAEFSFKVAVKNPDKSSSTEAVPEVATDKVSLWPVNVTLKTYEITVYSSSGAKVLTAVADGGVYQPIDIDISSLAPGVYTAELVSGTIKNTVKFVKI